MVANIISHFAKGVQLMELVQIFNDSQVVVSSLDVAERFNKEHRNVLQAINGYNKRFSRAEFSALFKEHYYTASNGKKNKMYYMNRDGFSFLVMGFTGEEAERWKLKYIKAFNKMEKALNKRIAIREAGKIARRNLTDTIRDEIPDSPHKNFVYSNFTDLVYKPVIGCSARQFRKKHGLGKKTNIRDYLSTDQIKAVDKYENLIKDLIRMGWEYKQIASFLKGQNFITA